MKQKCLLCEKEYVFLKKGSHIIPDFLIRSSFSLGKDKNKRDDNQIIFSATSLFDIEDPYVGIVGNGTEQFNHDFPQFAKNIDAVEKYNYPNHFTVDDILCSICETNLLGIQLETYFSNQVYRKIIENKATIKVEEGREFYEFKKVDLNKINKMIASIVWRCSLVQFDEFKLPEIIQEDLRKFIIGETNECPIFFRVIICGREDFDNQINNKFCILYYTQNEPALFVINNILIQLFLTKEQIGNSNVNFMNVNSYFKKDAFILNTNCSLEIPILNKGEWSNFFDMLNSILISQSNDDFNNPFIKKFNFKFGRIPTELEIHLFRALFLDFKNLELNTTSSNYYDEGVNLTIDFLQRNVNPSFEEMGRFVKKNIFKVK